MCASAPVQPLHPTSAHAAPTAILLKPTLAADMPSLCAHARLCQRSMPLTRGCPNAPVTDVYSLHNGKGPTLRGEWKGICICHSKTQNSFDGTCSPSIYHRHQPWKQHDRPRNPAHQLRQLACRCAAVTNDGGKCAMWLGPSADHAAVGTLPDRRVLNLALLLCPEPPLCCASPRNSAT